MAKEKDIDTKQNGTLDNSNGDVIQETVPGDVKENSILVTHNGDPIPEQVPIDRVPEKLFGNIRQQDVPELLESTIDTTISIDTVKEAELEDLGEMEEPSIEEVSEESLSEDVIIGSEPEEDSWDPIQAKSDMIDWATDENGKISKKSLMKWYLDVDAGDGQDSNSYRYQVGAIVNGEPHYCHKALDFSWDLASGNQTGVANRNIMKKIIFIKNREDIPLTEDQMDFTERHMEAYKQNSNCSDSEKIGSGPGSCGGNTNKASKINGIISFKKDTNTGKYASFEPESHVIKIGGKEVGSISEISNIGRKVDENSGKFAIRIMVKKEVTDTDKSPFKWQTFKKKFDTANDAKTWLKNNIDNIKKIDLYQMQDSAPEEEVVLRFNEIFLEDEHSPGGIDIVIENEIKMNSSPAGSKVIYEDESVIDVPVVPMREGVFTGTDGIPTLKKFEYFGKDAHWLEGQPILRGHTRPTELVTYKHNRIGKLMNVIARPDKKDVVAVARYYKDKISPEDLSRIKSGIPYDGSIAYTTHTSMTPGELNGTKYNAVEDGGYHFYHFAELPTGIGACSTKDGCGFMLNEKGYEPKVFYNDKRRAEVTQEDGVFSIKLNANRIDDNSIITKVYNHINNEQDAIKLSKYYVKTGSLPVITTKQNLQFSNLQNNLGNSMTNEEFIQADDSEIVDVQKMNEAFEQKLNERDAKIAELTAQVDDLVEKQNAIEQAEIDKRAQEDFDAFTMKLNKAHQKDAKVHYEGFKADGWAYFGAHPEVFQAEIPKMNAKGSPAAEGDNATALQQARDMLKKAQKERFGKRP